MPCWKYIEHLRGHKYNAEEYEPKSCWQYDLRGIRMLQYAAFAVEI